MSFFPLSQSEAWRNVIAITIFLCLIVGLPNFVFLTQYLPKVTGRYSAAGWFIVGLCVSMAIMFALTLVWLNHYNCSLRDLGWGKPTTPLAIILGVVFALAWLTFSFFGVKEYIPETNVLEISLFRLGMALLTVLVAIVEEIINRGFVITQLNEVNVPIWQQIVASGLCFAIYHSLGSFNLISLIPSFIFSAALAGIYVLGGYSLTPVIISHGLINFIGEPFLVMMILGSEY